MNSNNVQLDRSTSIFKRILSLIYSLFSNGTIIALCLIISLYMINWNRKSTSNPKKYSTRILNDDNIYGYGNDTGNNTDNDNNVLVAKPSLKEIYDFEYAFLNNITLIDYLGQWQEMKINNRSLFSSNEGTVEIRFGKIKNKNYVFSYDTNNSLNTYFFIKEGKYIDHCIEGNFSFSFPDNFIDDLRNVLEDNSSQNTLTITATNVSVDLIDLYLFSFENHNINETNITLSFSKSNKYLRNSYDTMIISSFAYVNLTISGNFSINIQAEIQFSNEIEVKVRNYSFLLSIFSFIDICLIFKLLVDVNENIQIGLNLDLITIIVSILYKSFIATAHFYLSLSTNNEEMSYKYGIPSILYFVAFSAFELRLLIYSWKARNIDIIFTNPNLFRRKMLIFYSLFYIAQLLSLISIKIIFAHFFTCFIVYLCTWTFQIIHSIQRATRPPMSNWYIILSTLSKVFLPIYLKAYDGNAFELRPSYLKVSIIVLFVLIQMVILLMQKRFGAKFLVPKCWKTLPYDYYRKSINVDDHISQNPTCVICLESLKEDVVDQEANKEDDTIFKIKDNSSIRLYIDRINNYFQSLSTPIKRQKYMITPCDHIYHSVCLESWMKLKNECPYCKRSIPHLE